MGLGPLRNMGLYCLVSFMLIKNTSIWIILETMWKGGKRTQLTIAIILTIPILLIYLLMLVVLIQNSFA